MRDAAARMPAIRSPSVHLDTVHRLWQVQNALAATQEEVLGSVAWCQSVLGGCAVSERVEEGPVSVGVVTLARLCMSRGHPCLQALLVLAGLKSSLLNHCLSVFDCFVPVSLQPAGCQAGPKAWQVCTSSRCAVDICTSHKLHLLHPKTY